VVPRQRHIIAMNQGRSPLEAEDGGDLARMFAYDTPGVA
jgi:hypothetical protein